MKNKYALYLVLWLISLAGLYSHAEEKPIKKTSIRSIQDDIKANKEEPKVLYIIPWKNDMKSSRLSSDFTPKSLRKLPKKTEEYNLIKSFPED